MKEDRNNLSQKLARSIDNAISVVSPQWAYNRAAARFSYDALKSSPRFNSTNVSDGPADNILTERTLSNMRAICYDLFMNNPLVKKLLKIEADDVVGTKLNIQARTKDEIFNEESEQAFKEEMIDRPCDITGRFAFNKILNVSFLNYRGAGDFFAINTDDGIQLCEGNQCGTPIGQEKFDNFIVTNGVATSKLTGKVLGYYIGKPNKWGYIESGGYKKYPAEVVYHVFNPDRISYTRGEPALTSSINFIRAYLRNFNQEIDAGFLNAYFSAWILTKTPERTFPAYTAGQYSSGKTEEGNKVTKLQPMTVTKLKTDEDIKFAMANRPPQNFKDIMYMIIETVAWPLCMPLMIATGDLSGATFMNARIANQQWKKPLNREQSQVLIPYAGWIRNCWLTRWIKKTKIKSLPEYPYRHEVYCQQMEYVDPSKEANADKIRKENRLGETEATILRKRGIDPREYWLQEAKDIKTKNDIIKASGLTEADFEPQKKEATNAINK